MKRRILVVDDEQSILLTLKALLEIYGFEVETALSAKQAIAKLRTASRYHMVVTDIKMEHDRAGYEVIREARNTKYRPPVAVLTAFPLLCHDWKEAGAHCLIVKPMNPGDLMRQIEAITGSDEGDKQKRGGVVQV
jgi:DNA-binding response OmpR family regulator